MMDFIILKVNGEDLSAATHSHIIKVFQTAPDPIIVEVGRRNIKMTDLSIHIPHNFDDSVNPYAATTIPRTPYQCNHTRSLFASEHRRNIDQHIGASTRAQYLQTDNTYISSAQVNDAAIDEEDEEQVQIFKEVVILRKVDPKDIFGLTLSYSALAANDYAESEVYISAIEWGSVASNHPGIRTGDQILQINGLDVHSKAQVVSMFQSCGVQVCLLIGRPMVVTRKRVLESDNDEEYSLVYEDEGGCEGYQPHLYQDSGIGRGVDDVTRTEDSSECGSAAVSLTKCSPFSSLDSKHGYVSMQHISVLMRNLALEYQQLHRLLQRPTDALPPQIQDLPPHIARSVPRMGTKLDNITTKSPSSTTAPVNSGNASSCSTGIDSPCKSPITLELGHGYNSSSILSLKVVDHSSVCGPAHYDDKTRQTPWLHRRRSSPSVRAQHTNDVASRLIDLNDHHTDNDPLLGYNYDDIYDPSNARGYRYNGSNKSQRLSENTGEDYINDPGLTTLRNDQRIEWVVKRRPDGSKYISRRPPRDKAVIDRDFRIFDNIFEGTTEEEALSMGPRNNRFVSDSYLKTDKPREKILMSKESGSIVKSDLSDDSAALSLRYVKYCYRNTIEGRWLEEDMVTDTTSML